VEEVKRMRELIFSLYHQNCGWCAATEKYPNLEITELSWGSNPVKANGKIDCHGFYSIRADDERSLEEALNYIKNIDSLHANVAELKGKHAKIFSRWETLFSPSLTANSYGCAYVEKVDIRNGLELHRLVSEDEKDIGPLVDSIDTMGDLKILKIGKYQESEIPFKLTEKQIGALKFAVENQYYEWPKKVKLEELAKASKVSRAAFQKSLRIAESKLIPQVIKKSGM
jgi:predicted DNA binding protein